MIQIKIWVTFILRELCRRLSWYHLADTLARGCGSIVDDARLAPARVYERRDTMIAHVARIFRHISLLLVVLLSLHTAAAQQATAPTNAEEISSVYADDVAAANAKYMGKVIEIKGTVNARGLEHSYILDGSGSGKYVRCVLRAGESEKAAAKTATPSPFATGATESSTPLSSFTTAQSSRPLATQRRSSPRPSWLRHSPSMPTPPSKSTETTSRL